MADVELGVEEQLAEAVARQTGRRDESFDLVSVRLVRLQLEGAEDGDRMEVVDSEELGADQRRELGRRLPGPQPALVDAEGDQVRREARAGLVAVHLLGCMPL